MGIATVSDQNQNRRMEQESFEGQMAMKHRSPFPRKGTSKHPEFRISMPMNKSYKTLHTLLKVVQWAQLRSSISSRVIKPDLTHGEQSIPSPTKANTELVSEVLQPKISLTCLTHTTTHALKMLYRSARI